MPNVFILGVVGVAPQNAFLYSDALSEVKVSSKSAKFDYKI